MPNSLKALLGAVFLTGSVFAADHITITDANGVNVQTQLKIRSGTAITEIATDGLMNGGNAALPTEGAVQTYVDARIAGGSTLPRVYVHAHASAGNISIPQNGSITLSFTAELSDAGNLWNGNRFTANAAGLYAVSIQVTLPSAPVNTMFAVGINKNGGLIAYTPERQFFGGDSIAIPVSIMVPLVAGDYIEISGQQFSSSARSIATTAFGSYVTIARVSP